jgi:hypothetical protein
MVVAGLAVETLFGILGLIPDQRKAKVVEATVTWNYTSILNVAFLVLSAVLAVRFLRTGGPAMLRTMSGPRREPMKHDSAESSNSSAHVHPEEREYVCPMHPEVVSPTPGRCPKCGMGLQPRDEAVDE